MAIDINSSQENVLKRLRKSPPRSPQFISSPRLTEYLRGKITRPVLPRSTSCRTTNTSNAIITLFSPLYKAPLIIIFLYVHINNSVI